MKRVMISGLTAIAVLASLAAVPADAKQLKHRNAAHQIHSGSFSARMGDGSVRPLPQKQQNLRGGRRQQHIPGQMATIHALNVYLQWRKCLDNFLPHCP